MTNSTAYKNARRRLAVLFSVPFVFSVAFFAVTMLSDRTDLELRRVQNLTVSVARLRSLWNDIELGEHGFLLTGSERYLIPLEGARRSLPAQRDACIRVAASQSPAVQQSVASLFGLVSARADQAANVLDVLRKNGPAVALDLVKSEGAVEADTRIRRAADDFDQRIDGIEARTLDSQRAWNRFSYLLFVLGTAAMVFVTMRLYHAALSYLHGRDQLQSQLHQLNAALESEVEERTRDLKVANEELQQFAYVASHDLQEPLRTITSFTQLLENRYRGRLDADADEFMGFIVTAARRMADLINGLLAMARLRKSGQSTAPVSLELIVQDVESNLAAAIGESAAQVTHDGMPSLVVDRTQIGQLLQNLVSNAIKYRRPEVPLRVHIGARRDDTHWVFSVADNGRGFNVQYAERIFGLFQRLPTEGGIEGTGIGLSIAKKIVSRHGGRIWAESTEGKGATFLFSLPVSLEVSRTGQEAEADASPDSRNHDAAHNLVRRQAAG